MQIIKGRREQARLLQAWIREIHIGNRAALMSSSA
jgi:hypothetical protein